MRFRVMLKGSGLVLRQEPEGGYCRYGFYATRVVKAGNIGDAKEKAVALLCREARALAAGEVPQNHEIEAIEVVPMSFFSRRPPGGFTFFPEDKGE